MKNVIFIVLVSSSLLIAQSVTIDSCAIGTAQDTICISDLVQQQINKAIEKQSQQIMPNVSEAKINIVPKVVITSTVNDPISNFVMSLPIHIQLFMAASFLILLGLLMRRAVLVVKRRSSRTLKNKISSLREEKVVAKENSKLKDERKKLKNRKSVFDASEKHISKLAKELNIAKGELILASRLKLFEIGKM